MKKVNIISVMMMLSLVLLAMASCGGSNDAAPTREDKAGFNSETNQVIEVGGFSFEIPDYYVPNEELSGENNIDYRVGDGEAVIRFATEAFSGSTDDFESAYETILDNLTSGITDDAKRNGNYFTCTVDGTPCSGKLDVFYNEASGVATYAIFMQQDTSSADFLPDWEKVLSSAKKLEIATSDNDENDNNDNDNDGEDRSETDISPEFKATMDSYEAFFDEYVDFMQKYNENPSDTALLLELSSMMTKEAEMLKQLEDMDESQMTTAEAAYYLEVTARINEKLASVL